MTTTFFSFFILIIIYSLISKRLNISIISSVMIFVAAGIILGSKSIGIINIIFDSTTFLFIAEIALVLTLFSDASRINISALKGSADLSLRMLIIGMPLTIALGGGICGSSIHQYLDSRSSYHRRCSGADRRRAGQSCH